MTPPPANRPATPANSAREFVVRVAAPSDARALAPILAELLRRPRLDDSLVEALNGNLLRLLQTPGATLLVAETATDSKVLLGFVSVWTRWGLFDQAPVGLVDRLVVRPSQRQSAVSAALLEQALGACQAMGCSGIDVVLTAESTINTEVLAGFGFIPQGERYFLEIM
jgi:GNAT superfamily N-acetyltransferase